MLESIANAIVSLLELLEAEGRTLRQKAVTALEGYLMVFFGGLLIFLGVIAATTAFYLWLSSFISKPAAVSVVALILAGFGTAILFVGHKHSKGGGGSVE